MPTDRTAGACALGFAASVVALNVMENVGTARPDPSAEFDEVVKWAADADAYLVVSTVLVPIAWVLLAVFAGTVIARGITAGADRFALTIAALGVAMTVGVLSAAIAADAVAIALFDDISADSVRLLTGTSTALYVMNWFTLALALFGLSRACAGLGVTRRWLTRAATGGSVLLALGSTQAGLAVGGALPGLLLGLLGFAVWLVFLVVTGVQLVRGAEPAGHSLDAPAGASPAL